ncbi:MAG: DUF58 domain-containing protein [Gammaproteobacteria bacterium]|nr:MAG: DUF58 domain-containing protein [Gammaproteobacteria bacterium]
MSLHPQLDDLLELRHQARTLGVAAHHLVNSTFTGLYASVFRGTGLDFDEVREYREGDDIRNMDWLVTARTNVPHLKVFREERQRSVILCIDTGPHMSFGTRGTFKSIQAARTAALIGWAASKQHDRVGGVLFGNPATDIRYFRATPGRRGLWRLLRALTEPIEQGDTDESQLMTALRHIESGAATGSLIFVIAPINQVTTGLEHILGSLRQRHDVVLLPVDDPADIELPDMGTVIFSNAAGELLEVDTGNAAGREAFREDWQQRREELQQLSYRLGFGLIPISTNEDVHRTLINGLRHYAARK